MARRKYTEVEEKLMNDIAQNLKKILISKKWYQKDLAAAAGLSTSVVSDYISAKTLASPGVIEKMAEEKFRCCVTGFSSRHDSTLFDT